MTQQQQQFAGGQQVASEQQFNDALANLRSQVVALLSLVQQLRGGGSNPSPVVDFTPETNAVNDLSGQIAAALGVGPGVPPQQPQQPGQQTGVIPVGQTGGGPAGPLAPGQQPAAPPTQQQPQTGVIPVGQPPIAPQPSQTATTPLPNTPPGPGNNIAGVPAQNPSQSPVQSAAPVVGIPAG